MRTPGRRLAAAAAIAALPTLGMTALDDAVDSTERSDVHFGVAEQERFEEQVSTYVAEHAAPTMPVEPTTARLDEFDAALIDYVDETPWVAVHGRWDCVIVSDPIASEVEDPSGDYAALVVVEAAIDCGDLDASDIVSSNIGEVEPASPMAAPGPEGGDGAARTAVELWGRTTGAASNHRLR